MTSSEHALWWRAGANAACLALLRHHMPEGIRWTTPGGGPLLWVECPRRVSLRQLALRLRAHHLVLSLSDSAFFGEPHLHGFKLGYAFLSPSEMERCIDVLARELRVALAALPAEARGRALAQDGGAAEL